MKLPNFDRVARLYRWAEYACLGPLLERTREHYISALLGRRRALILGDGDGRFTAALLRRNPGLSVDAVDLSGRMLALLQQRSPGARLHRLDARTQLPQGSFDLVVTHFFLDCLSQAETDALVAKVAQIAAPGALWLVSDFRVPDGLLRWPARLYIRTLYLAFRWLTGLRITRLPDHARALSAAGFEPVLIHHKLGGILTTELWRLGAFPL